MYQPAILFIGLRYMRGRASDRFARFVSWLSSIGITLGVMALIIVLSVMNGFERQLKTSLLSLMPQALITSSATASASPSLDPKEFPIEQFKHLDGVQRIVPLTTADVVIQSANNIGIAVMLGINPQDSDPLIEYSHYLEQAELLPKSYNVIIGDKIATRLSIEVGDKIRIMVPSASQLTPMGRIPSQRLFTVVDTFYSYSEADATQILLNQEDASRLMRYPAGNITGWRLYLDDPFNVTVLSQSKLDSKLAWKDWRDKKGELFQAVKMERNMMGLLISLIIIVAAFNLITSLGLLVMEKQGEVAILQTQGLTPKQIMQIFMIQGASAGVVGAILGSILGILISLNIDLLIPTLGGITLPVLIKPIQVVVVVVFAILISLLSTLYPSWRAAAVHPAEALRYE